MTADDVTRQVGAPAAEGAGPEPREIGDRLGRYSVLESIGHGGMGTVVRAYDPKLRREVALKRVRVDVLDDQAESRLVREAQAMAQLTHANVVAVYDVDILGHDMVLAMEYVRGQTLRAWFREKPAWQDVVDTMLEAGQGLAAAHAAGLVHRDFKPANVLLGEDGTVKVTDFGLAKTLVPGASEIDSLRPSEFIASEESDGSGVGEAPDDLTASPLTASNAVIGTPRYMAPEQHAGHVAEAAADQYAFCVALWEGLCGTPPFRAGRGLPRTKCEGPPSWPDDAAVPRRLAHAARRGLSVEPQDRWPSMDALLAELRATRGGTQGRRWVAAGVGVATLGVVLAASLRADADQLCGGASPQIAEVWGADHRASLEQTLLATGVVYARSTASRVVASVDDYAARWATMHTQTCEATQVRHEQSEGVMDLRMACLDRAKRSLAATIRVLSDADAAMMQEAIDLTHGLPALGRCEDVAALQAAVPPPEDPEIADAVRAAGGQLAEVHTRIDAGRNDEAGTILQSIDSLALSHPPLRAAVQVAWGELAQARDEDGEPRLREGTRLAFASGDLLLAAGALSNLASQIGHLPERHAEALWLANLGVSLVRGHAPEGEEEAEALHRRGWVKLMGGRPQAALEDATRHLELAKRLPEPNEGAVLEAQQSYAVLLDINERTDEALVLAKRVLDKQRAFHGDDHPKIAEAMNSVAVMSWHAGRYDEANEFGEETVRIEERIHGPNSTSLADRLSNLVGIKTAMGRYDEAERLLSRAEKLAERVGPLRPDLLGTIHWHRIRLCRLTGRYADGEALARRRLTDARNSGKSERTLQERTAMLARILRDSGELDEALALYRSALELAEPPDEPDATWFHVVSGMGITHLQLGQLEEARGWLERATGLPVHADEDPVDRAETALAFADLLIRLGEREAAVSHAREALRLYESLGLAHAADAREAERLLSGTSDG